MKTENELNNDILKVTMEMDEKFPELSKYREEMPIIITDMAIPAINTKNLMEYYESLAHLLNRYSKNHIGKSK